MSASHYYIDTGRKHGLYTLRVEFEEPTYFKSEYGTLQTGMTGKDHYVMSLTRDPHSSVTKAEAFLTSLGLKQKLAVPDFSLNDIGRSDDWTIFHGGKHEGKSIEWVLQNDPEYALWAAENLSGKTYAKTVDLLRTVLAPVLQQRAAERSQKALSAEDSKKQRIHILTPVAQILHDGQNGFRDDIASDMITHGRLPTGRGLQIVLDILSRVSGRRGSKAYDAEFDRLNAIFESLGG